MKVLPVREEEEEKFVIQESPVLVIAKVSLS
jgi:hypothetical protein